MLISGNKIRKIAALTIALSILTAFTACSSDENTNNTAVTAVNVSKPDNSYRISSVEYKSDNGDVNILYPKISGLYDEAMQDYYNELFKSDFAQYMDNDDGYMCFANYEVTLKTADLLSIVFRYWAYTGGVHPYQKAYAYTISLDTGETLIPSDVVGIDKEKIYDNFYSGNGWDIVYSPDDVYSKSHYIEYYEEYGGFDGNLTESNVITVKRNSSGNYSKSGNFGCRSYLDSSYELVLIIEVGYMWGDYLEIKFK